MLASSKDNAKPVLETAETEPNNASEPAPIPSKVGQSKAHVVADGTISTEEKARLQSMIGNANAQDTRAFVGQKGVTQDITDVNHKATLAFSGCSDCTYTIKAYCTKVFVQACTNFKLVVDSKIITSTVEVYKSDNVEMCLNTKVATVQLDICNNVNISYPSKDMFDNVFWAGVENLKVRIEDTQDTNESSFSTYKAMDNTLVFERSQFKTHYVFGKLQTEKVIRLDNGFPTTIREKSAFEKRQEENLEKLQDEMFKDMGIRMNRKAREGPKVGRNDKCPCSSGRKFKACCGKYE
eukprot:CFRG3869T1